MSVNCIHHVSHTGGGNVCHCLWAAQHGFKSRVCVQGVSRASDVQCLLDPPSVPICMLKHWCLTPSLDVVAWAPYMGCDGIVDVGLPYCCLVLCNSGLQLPSCFSNVYWSTLTRNLVHHDAWVCFVQLRKALYIPVMAAMWMATWIELYIVFCNSSWSHSSSQLYNMRTWMPCLVIHGNAISQSLLMCMCCNDFGTYNCDDY